MRSTNNPQTPASFPLQRHGWGRHQQLQRWEQWLLDPMLPARKRLLEAIRSDEIPAHLLHHFACDCLERHLHYARTMHIPQSRQSWLLLHSKRQWIEGNFAANALQQQRESLQALCGPTPEQKSQKITWMAASAASPNPQMAARYACLYEIQPGDHDWQCEHLSQQLQTLRVLERRLLSLLFWRWKLTEGTLERMSLSYENSLFHGTQNN